MSMELAPPSVPYTSSSTQGDHHHHNHADPTTTNPAAAAAASPSALASSYHGEAQYPFCDMKFFGLNLMDFAALSFLAYLKKDSRAFDAFFNAAFDQSEWSVLHAPDPKHAGAVFVDVYNSRLNMSVVAIRGTNPKNLFDIYQDMVMFNGAFMWDVTGLLVPLVRWIPQKWTAHLLYFSYLPMQVSGQEGKWHAYDDEPVYD